MTNEKLVNITPQNIENSIETLDGWAKVTDREAIQKSFKFKDFISAFAFMTACAAYAEEINHHPEWFNIYNRVDVTLNTHDIGSLSQLDISMAKKMNELAAIHL